VGDTVYRTMLGADKFSPDYLLDKLDISSEHDALKMANRVEAAMYVWRRKASASHGKARWSKVKELAAVDNDKNVALANRAESLLLCLKHRFPGLSQTTLDTSKIQYNKVICTYHIAISYSFHLKGKSMRPWQSNWMTQQQILLFFTGRWASNLGELLKGVGELGVQHGFMDRRCSVRRQIDYK
jgi:hypothetical protein